MNMKNKPLILIILSLIASFVWQLITLQSISLLETSNSLFFIAGILLIFALLWLTLSSGVFDFFNYSMRKSLHLVKKSEEKLEVKPLSKSVGTGFRTFLISGALLLIISLFALLGYYL
ncbi:DUF3899 domain-containing protein [Carnobacterium divergens]|uniref:DUF3899 domain-containing protein n=1 Tax=Carnobacterium divergens TaxID=2748 RepID=UPI001EE9631D|nr:DUF3899 domain-containing protein [Carnobacterium divergens]